MSTPNYPIYSMDRVFCFNCKAQISGPFQASGHAKGRGAMRGQCSGCKLITYFDVAEEETQRPTYPEPVESNVREAEQRGHVPLSQGCGMFRCRQCDARGFLDMDGALGLFSTRCDERQVLAREGKV